MSNTFVRPGAARVKTQEERDAERAERLTSYLSRRAARRALEQLAAKDEQTLERVAGFPSEIKAGMLNVLPKLEGYDELTAETRDALSAALSAP